MTARELKDLLARRYPGNVVQGMAPPWTVIEEWRGIDVLAWSSWSSVQNCGRIGHEVKVSRGDLRKELLKPHKRATNVAWCFNAGTLITTPTGLRRIEELKSGDWVISAEGNRRKVIANATRTSESCLKIKGQGFCSTTTAEHPYLVRRRTGWRPSNLASEEWVAAGELIPRCEGHYVCLPTPTISGDGLTLSSQTAYVLGRYVADGWTTMCRPKNRPREYARVYICSSHAEADELRGYLDEAGIEFSVYKGRTVVEYSINGGSDIAKQFLPFGSCASQKRVTGDVLAQTPSVRAAFLSGYADGDGSVHKDGIRALTISRELAYGITAVARSLGYTTTLVEQNQPVDWLIEGRPVKQAPIRYHLSWYPPKIRSQVHIDNDGRHWAHIREIVDAEPETVYNLSVDGDHTFIADGVAVHNCNEFFFAVPEGLLTKEEIAYEEPEWEPMDWLGEHCPGFRGIACRSWYRRKTHVVRVPIPTTGWEFGWTDITCPTCKGKGVTTPSRVEREAPTCWVPRDVGLIVVSASGSRVVKKSPKRKDVPELGRHELAQLVRWVSMRPDPRHRSQSSSAEPVASGSHDVGEERCGAPESALEDQLFA